MTDINMRGATADEWFHFDFVLGLAGNLLPCVPAGPDVRVLAGSQLEGKVGKIPSQFNRNGEAHGIKEWQKRPILGNEVALWSKDPRLNICVRTGPISQIYAIDCDIDDMEVSHEVLAHIFKHDSAPALRTRSNSGKWLFPFRMETPCKKRKIKLDNNPKGPAIELLADGQQFVAAGSHSSGVRYLWRPGLPDQIPTLTLEQLNQLWTLLTAAFATVESQKVNQIAVATESATQQQTTDSASKSSSDASSSPLTEISDDDWQRLKEALSFLAPLVTENDTWSKVGYALLSLKATRPCHEEWIKFDKASKYVSDTNQTAEGWWKNHERTQPKSDFRTILKLAHDCGMVRVADVAAFAPITAEAEAAIDSRPETVSGGAVGHETDGNAVSVVPSGPIKPIIRIGTGGFSAIVEQLEDTLVPYAYVQGPHLVRQSEAHTHAKIQRVEDALMLILVTPEWAYKRFDELITWQQRKMGDDGKVTWVNTDPSAKHVTNLLGQAGWRKLRPLNALARAPFVRDDGSICEQPGYDHGSRVLLVPSATFPAIPTDPGYDQAHASLERIRGVFDQFPWKNDAAESAFLSHILSEAARLAIDRCPMFFYDAPASGTGKSLLQEMAARIVHGTDPALRPWVGNGDELRKSLYASLLAGDRSLWFDNVPTGSKIRSPELCAFITSETWKDRKLGESESLGVPNKCVLVASGNNITPVGDMSRRSIVIRMDANTEKLRERTFRIPQLRRYVMKNRPELLVHALTIIKAFHAQGLPDSDFPVALPGMESWSHFCRDPLIWLGRADPVITQKEETDDEVTSVGTIFQRLAAQFGDREFTGLDVAHLVNGLADSNGELANDMQQNGCKEPNSPTVVGYWLRGCRDVNSGGYKLVHADRSTKGQKWKLIKTNEDLT